MSNLMDEKENIVCTKCNENLAQHFPSYGWNGVTEAYCCECHTGNKECNECYDADIDDQDDTSIYTIEVDAADLDDYRHDVMVEERLEREYAAKTEGQ